MNGNLKAMGLALAAVFAIGAFAAQGASAAVEHEFHSDGEKTVVTGTNKIIGTSGESTVEETSVHEITIGAAGVVKCTKVQTESTQVGTQVSEGTYKTDQITVTPHYSECTFGPNPATVNFSHCAYVFDSDTTSGNSTGGEHANVAIECEIGSLIEIVTVPCTLTIAPQEIKHAARYENDPHNQNAIKAIWTGHQMKIGKTNDKAGCALIPTGEIGKYTGTTTHTCFKDEGTTRVGTDKTTPTETTIEGAQTECKVSNT